MISSVRLREKLRGTLCLNIFSLVKNVNITVKIHCAEETYEGLLESYFVSIYPADKLISHGLEHHRRVWEYAKELLQYIDNKDYTINKLFAQKLLIGCYLHDIGMTIDTGERHGRYSREICRKFLKENNLDESDYQDLLKAIENHDNKGYSDNETGDDLQIILSVADDLDAFGETGISRYLEIYQERGIEKHQIGTAVRDNANKRFENFNRLFSNYPDLIARHRGRFLVLDNYFKNNYLTTDLHGSTRS